MLKVERLLAITGIGAIASLCSICTPAQAQSTTLSVSPMVTIAPVTGAQARAEFVVTNNGSEPLRARVYAVDFNYDREQGFVKTGSHPNSANPYLQFSPKELVVPPGVTRTVRVNITIPPSQPDGEYRIAVFTEDLQARKTVDSNQIYTTTLRPEIASVFFISKGTLSAKLGVSSVSWNTKTNQPRLVFKNQGTATAFPTVNWKIQQGSATVASSKLQGILLQAERERAFDLGVTAETKLKPGTYTLIGEIDNRDGKLEAFSLPLTVPGK